MKGRDESDRRGVERSLNLKARHPKTKAIG